MTLAQHKHYSVLGKEAIESLNIKSNGVYIDCTYGRGGHAQKIWEKIQNRGTLVVIDCDPEAIAHAKAVFC